MSAKARFLQKLQDKHSCTGPYASKDQADLVAFCQCLGPLQENIETWLAETGITRINNHCALTEMLISNSAFTVPCFELHYENRGEFTPVFLYGQGVTGCVDVTLVASQQTSALCRLFMRSAESQNWTYTPARKPGGQRVAFDEEAFFTVIAPLLP
ncbi:Uncharacterised protein [Serratia quinivorans]|uniref:Uncharacterized protein n=1 Tax=Serratia quinivorans TaxID=137545 RepID=A0A380AKG2_9GAMM|nr:Uncharacterised protein [Serratia quinivorans]